MFSRTLTEGITLAGEMADHVFPNIAGDMFNSDVSFVATLRACLLSRIGEDSVDLRYTRSSLSEDRVNHNSLKDIAGAYFGEFKRGKLIVHSAICSDAAGRNALFELLDNPEKGFLKTFSGFEEMTNIRDFVAPVMKARFYTNVSNHVIVIIVDMLNVRKWHYIQSFIPRYFKWLFAESPVTAEEVALLASLTKKSPDDYERLIAGFADKFDMRTLMIKNVLGELERRSRRDQLDRTDEEINGAHNRIEEFDQEYARLIKLLDELNVRRAGLVEMINQAADESELVDYFTANKSLDVLGSSGSEFEFIVKTYLDTWDPDLYEKMTKKPGSSLYEGYRVKNAAFLDKKDRKLFLDAIFSDDPDLRLKICGYYSLNIHGGCTSARGYRYPNAYNDRLPNPHLQKFNCFGNHSRLINASLRKGDTIGAVEQCISSCKSLNLTEPQTFQWFFEEYLFKTDAKVIELPDHTSVSPVDALQWLKEKEEHKDEAD